MRIRQVKPSFWTDARMASLSDGARLFYIGLWNLADDAGWLEWDADMVGAHLFPYRTLGRRRKDIDRWSGELREAGRVVIHDCGCAHIPRMTDHQRVAGKQSMTALSRHKSHLVATDSRSEPLIATDSPVKVKVKVEEVERNGTGMERNGSARDRSRHPEGLNV